jgi:NRAMP (natural resistance-associated macrophage protein)-like metal ion transporter
MGGPVTVESIKPRLLDRLGPGLITGASDDDPSGIATYSQIGAQFGYTLSWTMLFSLPLMAAIQEISARIGRVTGRGIAGNLCRHYPRPLLYIIVALLIVANTINIGADLGAMADATKLLIGGNSIVYLLAYGVLCVWMQIFLRYAHYVSVLKYLTLSLFTYFATTLVVAIPWGEVAHGLFIPTLTRDAALWTSIVAILGTTISPYLFFWQASQEVEEIGASPRRDPLKLAPHQAESAFQRIKLDTYLGMLLSNLVALAIIVTTAATLHASGVKDIQTSAQAAEALKPVAGEFAFAVFTLGILGTGLLAVPVLAGSAAYGVGEALRWPTGLSRKPREARAFYLTLSIATLVGVGMNFFAIDPIRALFWSAVLNGVVAAPVMALMMGMTANRAVMGEFIITGSLRIVGWLATLAMAAAVLGFALTAYAGSDR